MALSVYSERHFNKMQKKEPPCAARFSLYRQWQQQQQQATTTTTIGALSLSLKIYSAKEPIHREWPSHRSIPRVVGISARSPQYRVWHPPAREVKRGEPLLQQRTLIDTGKSRERGIRRRRRRTTTRGTYTQNKTRAPLSLSLLLGWGRAIAL